MSGDPFGVEQNRLAVAAINALCSHPRYENDCETCNFRAAAAAEHLTKQAEALIKSLKEGQ